MIPDTCAQKSGTFEPGEETSRLFAAGLARTIEAAATAGQWDLVRGLAAAITR